MKALSKFLLMMTTSLLGQKTFAQVPALNELFAQKEVAQIAAAVEFRDFRGQEELISCKNFRMRLSEASDKNAETAAAVSAEEFRYVLDHTKSYLGFFDYHALTKLKLTWKLPESVRMEDEPFVTTLETQTLKVVSSSADFMSFNVSNYEMRNQELSFEIDLTLADLCLGKGLTFSLYQGCAQTDLMNLDCTTSQKINLITGSLESFHPTKIRLEKTRLSELGLGDEYE